ncbi:MAG: radical SAM protein [Candidatus Verstraetearchaeota archaeon]|nr:radical SAM protein [Candidatus Verstraetearchaeota archaeon]
MNFSTYRRLIKTFIISKLGKYKPLTAFYNVTFRCNFKCSFCNNWKRSINELSEADALKVIKRIGDFGVPAISFSGGEPLLRRDIYNLALEAKDYGCIVSMNSNGYLINSHVAEKLAKVFDYIIISIDGPPKLHDKFRGVIGAYEKAVEAIKLLRKNGVKIGVNTVVSRENMNSIIPLWKSLEEKVDFFTIQPINPPSSNFKEENVRTFISSILAFKKKSKSLVPLPVSYITGMGDYLLHRAEKICHAAKLYFMVQPNGMVTACSPREDLVIGNILETPLDEILKVEDEQVKAAIASCKGCWLTCTTGISLIFKASIIDLLAYVKLR